MIRVDGHCALRPAGQPVVLGVELLTPRADIITRRTALGLGLAGAASLGGCARARDPQRLSWWAMSTQGEFAPLLLTGFTRATGIGVDVQALPWTAAHAKILTAFAGGTLPDVMMVANSWLAELAAIGVLAPAPPAALRSDQFGGLRSAAIIAGRALALPWTAETQVQFYHRDLLAAAGYDAPPAGWSDWQAMLRAVKRRAPFAVLLLLDWPEQLMNFALQAGAVMLRDHGGRGNFRSAEFRYALGFYRSLFTEGLAPPVTGTEAGDTLGALHDGYFAILPAAAQTVGDLRRRAPVIPTASWSVADMPAPRPPAPSMVTGNSLVVSHSAADPARAWRLVDYLCRPDVQVQLNGLTGDLPARPSAWAAPQLVRDPYNAVFAAQLGAGIAVPAVPEWQRIMTDVQLIAERMVRGEFGVDAAAEAMDAQVDRLLAKRRWLLDRGAAA